MQQPFVPQILMISDNHLSPNDEDNPKIENTLKNEDNLKNGVFVHLF